MKKLSIILGTSLIALGLLVSSSTNAMTYVVNGSSTSIAIPTGINGTTIKRCQEEGCEITQIVNEGNGCGENKCCQRPINSHSYIECSHNYGADGTYTVYFDGKNNEFDNLYLDAANIEAINDYSDIRQITNLFLGSNTGFVLGNNTFSNTPVTNLYLDHNNISSYSTNIPNNFNILSLESNELTTIPDIVRSARSRYRLKLSTSQSYNPYNISNKYIDLSNNKINFIEIISSSHTVTTYSPQVFGYTYNDSILDGGKITYNYEIFPKNNEINVLISGSIQGNNGANTDANIPLTPSLEPGTYRFKICIDGATDVCKRKDFTISYTVGINLNHPDTVDSIDDINVSRQKTGNYPDELIAGYIYEFDGEPLNTNPDNTTSYTITTTMLQDNPAGPHTFKVYLKRLGGDTIAQEPRTFTIDINNDISIIKPSTRETGEGISEKEIDLEWDNESTLFHHYIYSLSTANSCSEVNASNSIIPSTTVQSASTNNGRYTHKINLGRGDYLLCIDMYSNNNKLNEETVYRKFSVEFLPTLSITAPDDSISSQPIEFRRDSFMPNGYNFQNYTYTIKKGSDTIYSGESTNFNNKSFTYIEKNLSDGTYTFNITINYNDTTAPSTLKTLPIKTKTFEVGSNIGAQLNITPAEGAVFTGKHTTKVPVTLSWAGTGSLLISKYFYRLTNTDTSEVIYSGYQDKNESGSYSIGEKLLGNGNYKFQVFMLDSYDDLIISKPSTFTVNLPPSIQITAPTSGTTITSSSTTFSWVGYSDNIWKYDYQISGDPTIYSTTATSVTTTLKNGTYTLTVWLYRSDDLSRPAAEDSINFTVNIPPVKTSGGGGGGSSGKTHYTNNLTLSLGNDSPAANEWIKLIVKIDDKYVGKVTFPKLQHYSADTEKREDIPVTSKNYVSDYSDDAKLGYIKFSSDDDGRKDLEQFVKFSKNGYYRIYAEDKDGYDTYVEFKVSGKTTQTSTNTSNNNTTVSNTSTIDNILQQYIPEVYRPQDTSEEVYIARSCKKYTIRYSESLNVYTSPNLNMNEYFVSKDYFKRYVDSKNKYQSGCPTNIGWISTNYSDKTNDDTRYTAPNGKVYFITGRDGNYYSNELNKELKTPTSFRTIQELKYYIRDRNPLISMAALGPTN